MTKERLREYYAKATLPTMDTILSAVLEQKPDFFERVGKEQGIEFVNSVRNQMVEMETVARLRRKQLPKTAEEAEKIKAIIVISAPGTYLAASKGDRYQQYPWSRWMDHRRIEYAAYLIRNITEIKTGERLNNPQKFRESISREGPYLLYSGRPDEQDAIRAALISPHIHMPEERVILIGGEIIDNTIHQAQRLYLPKEISLQPGDQVGLVLHSAQAVRFAYTLQQAVEDNLEATFQNLPEPFPNLPFRNGVPILKMFPLPIPTNPLTNQPSAQYPTLEICGLIHYAFYDQPKTASEKPFPYQF